MTVLCSLRRVECLLFGAMFSATDPVAVVAVLKEVEPLSKQLLTLVIILTC